MEENASAGLALTDVGEKSIDNNNQESSEHLRDAAQDSVPKAGVDITEAQAQCYTNLSRLLEKSQKYTAHLNKRIDGEEETFALFLKEKSKQFTKWVSASTPKTSQVVKKKGRPPKRKYDQRDQVVPNQGTPEIPSTPESGENSVAMQETEGATASTSDQVEKVGGYTQPILVTGGKLRKYQLEGAAWLTRLYVSAVNGILADEMGLGKTIQCISMLADVICVGASGPFLVCGPLSTMFNWSSEFERFAPAIPRIMYYGEKDHRKSLIRLINSPTPVKGHPLRCKPVVITTYEMVVNDSKQLQNIVWDHLIVDEGHRMKNSKSRLFNELKCYKAHHRLLLTGTPLQNDLTELWTLLNFLIPEIFNSAGSFESWFNAEFFETSQKADRKILKEDVSTISKIHQILTPFMLRRLKSDVDIVIPPKKELLVVAPFTAKQKDLYKSILDRTIADMLNGGTKKVEPDKHLDPAKRRGRRSVNYSLSYDDEKDDEDDESSLTAWAEAVVKERKEVEARENIVDQLWKQQPSIHLKNMLSLLRKCCNHPYLLQPKKGGPDINEEFIMASGKLYLLDRMLKKLKSQNHRVLIFSQSTQLLDILEDCCLLRKYSYCRLDGSMNHKDRYDQIKEFSENDIFLFLLSTRAGGLGINLTSADTVVIYDSDWNPQCDLQAQDRCHRLGQSRPVVVYRLVTGGSVDQKIVERATAKRKLEKIIIHKDKFKVTSSDADQTSQSRVIDPRELLSVLEETDYQDVIDGNVELSDEDLDRLLDRSDLVRMWEEKKAEKIRQAAVNKEADISEKNKSESVSDKKADKEEEEEAVDNPAMEVVETPDG